MERLLYLSLALLLVLTSCERAFFRKNQASRDPFVNFDYLWEEVNKKYSYFELKAVDWDEVKARYRAQLREDMREEELFEVLAAMLNELRDDHTNLVAPFNTSSYNLPLQHRPNYNPRTIEEFYLPQMQRTGAFRHDFLANGRLAYLRYSSFASTVSPSDMDYILERYKDTEGLILDLRSNGGGAIFNIPEILERFCEERVHVAYSRTRSGLGRDEFTEPGKFYMNAGREPRYLKPVIALIDRSSYSATTFFSLCTKALPQVRLFGDTTGGGGGLPNGGQLPNGWTYRFSVTQLLDLDKRSYAEDGVPPDVYVEFDWNDLSRDEVLEAAMQALL